MAIAKMNLAKFSGNADMLDKLIRECCVEGNFHPEQASNYISSSMGFISYFEENSYKEKIKQLEELAQIAGYRFDDKTIEFEKDINDGNYGLIESISEKIKYFSQQQKDLMEQKSKIETGISIFSHYIDLDINLEEISESEFILSRFGRMPKESFTKFNNSESIQKNPYLIFIPCSQDDTSYWGVYFTPKDKKDEIDRIFAGLYFERFDIPGATGTPKDVIRQLKQSIEIIQKQSDESDREIRKIFSENENSLKELYASLVYRDRLYELKKYAVVGNGYFYLVGWVTRDSVKKITETVEKIDGISVEFSTPEEVKTSSPPVKLKNIKLARPFEFFVDMYGLPGYNDVDVTSFVAITYTVIFGLMFGDVGQGFVLSLVGFLMWKLKKTALGKALIPCGISSMCFGFVFGSVFGFEEMLDPIYEKLGMNGKPLSVMESVNTILVLAIGIGVGLMCIAMIINIYSCIKKKHFGEAIFSQNGLVGLIFYASIVCFGFTFMSNKTIIPSSVLGITAGIGAVLLMIKEIPIGIIDKHPDWKPESAGDFIAQNIFELLEYILSYASNTVSFLRVGAFVLVHAGMMMVVFSLAGESQNIVVIILGNILVIALEGLLTGIQVLRLEFYEMFSRFYEGNGRPFNAIKLKK